MAAPTSATRASVPDDTVARQLRGFGPLGILAILIIVSGALLSAPLSAVFVLVWVWRSLTPWSAIGYIPPSSWPRTIVGGIALGVALKLVMKIVVMPLLGAPPVNQAYHYLARNPAALPFALFALVLGAGFGEETVFRGYAFERLGKLFGATPAAKVFIVLVTSALFAIAHWSSQGLPGTEQAVVTGLVFGGIFAATGRIAMLMIAHASFDLAALAMIYFDVESKFAHFLFR